MEPATAAPGGAVVGRLTAKLEPGWHLYSATTPRPPIATSIGIADSPLVEKVEAYQPKPERKYDPNFQVETETFNGDTVFLLAVRLKAGAAEGESDLTAQVRYQACDDRQCLPPVRRSASARLVVRAGAASTTPAIPAGYSSVQVASAAPAAPAPALPQGTQPQDEDLGRFLLIAFGFGVAAIFTPCVFPMIPITMSFFLNRPGSGRGGSISQAATFCLGIVVLFSLLGVLTTAILGPFGVIQLASNPWVNAFIAAVFLAFGLSLLGAFEITLPSSLLTRLDRASQKGGIGGTLLMGLTFSLTSFACVGPFVGTLLAASAQSGGFRPVAGMLAFAVGLASPFFFLALFPSYLQRMPRSGGWLARVKVVLGFIILAAMLKYVSNIDQVLQWNSLTRERFLAAWVVLFLMPGLYLLGFLRLEGIKPDEKLGVGRLLVASAFLIFAISLIPGMFGGRLGELDAYVPLATQTAGPAGVEGKPAWMKNQYREALDRARAENKHVLLNFTGYACTNCHWMKANMFTRPEIASAMAEFVLVELYTDGADDASARNQALQEKTFSTIAIPYYAILTADEKVIAAFPGLTRKPDEFLGFLRSGSKQGT